MGESCTEGSREQFVESMIVRDWMPIFVPWMLNVVYVMLLVAVSPILVYRRIVHGKYRGGWREKLTGALTRRYPERQCIWFHAVSVGEVLQLQKLLDETASRFPLAELFITTTTDTGFDVARSKYPQHTVAYFPLDFSWAVRNALRSIRPSLVVLVELELWPNFIFSSQQLNVPLALINGRIGEKSFRGYSRLKPLLRRVLSCFTILGVQNETYADRLIRLGADARRVVVTGNIKFDRVETNRVNPATENLRRAFGIGGSEKVFIAGSTQDPEESYALDCWLALRQEVPSLRLVVVPRHKERFDEVARMIEQRGVSILRRSATKNSASIDAASDSTIRSSSDTVLLLDTLGELGACWGLADVAFVGGSLTRRGGQNMLEPAAYGTAVLFGPNTWNFRDITEALLNCHGAEVVHGPEELAESVRRIVLDPQLASRMGDAARRFVGSQNGATARTMDLLVKCLASSDSLIADRHAA